ncbi:eukaryotic translation initiation factor 4 gamma 1 isoform X2 [Trematomus bernacchii]|nr:eukaryotic translation initiation factor 4 gamma 1 isoform X2 [Trematomus bernacchii]
MGMGVGGPRRSAQMQSLSDDIQLNKAEKAWKPSTKKTRVEVESESDDSEHGKTQELFKSVRSILNKLTPQKFQQLMKMVTDLTIDTEERLKGVIDLTFEKAIAEPNFSVVYANMCRCLMGLKVETTDKPGVTVNFRKLLLNRCQKDFEKGQVDDEIFERKQKELDAATVPEEKQRLTEQLQREKDNAHRCSMGNIKFIGELFKLKMLTEAIMHDCIVKLLKNHDEESLECLCRLLSSIGKDVDFEKAKPRMDQYFNQMEKIIKDRKTSSRIRFMLQDVLDLRRSSWVPRRGEQGPKTIEQIHKDAELEEQREQMNVQHAFISKLSGGHGGRNDGGRNDGGRNDGGARGGREGRYNQGRRQPPQDEGWNTVPISTKNRPIDTSRLSKITKTPALDFNNQVLGPGGKGMFGSWGKGNSGGSTTAKPAEAVTREKSDTPPPPPASTKPTLTEEELTKKSTAIIEEYLHLNDMKEALQCVHEMSSTQLLFLFVQTGLESTLERSTIARERMGLLLQQLIKAGTLPKQQYYNGLQEILEVAEDMAIDIPHIWLYLAELISPMLREGGIPMGELFREISKPLIPLGQAGVLLVQILNLLCKERSHKKAGAMWREGGLRWRDFLPEDVDVNKFMTEKKVEFTLGVESEDGQKEELSSEELSKQIQRLIQDQADDQRLFDWIEDNLDEQQMSSNMLVRALMTCICQSAIIYENPNKVDAAKIKKRAKVLQKYLSDDKKELQALYALQALMVELEQPANLLRMFFDSLYDEDVIKEEAFYKWESSKDPAEQQGKGVALKSVTAFFTWIREAAYESYDS